MLGYDFEIIYKKGKQNMVENALSRKDEDVEALFWALSIIQPDWVVEAREEKKNDLYVWTSFNKYKRIPMHYSLFCGKMIHYGIMITYIYVRTPNSSKSSFQNYTPLLFEGT